MADDGTVWAADEETKPAPGALLLIQELVNTVELPAGPDRLADPDDARAWLVAHRLLPSGADLPRRELDMLRGIREALRALLVHNAGGPQASDAALAPLRAVADRGAVRVEITRGGDIALGPTGESLPERLVELLLAIRDAQHDGSWARLKACGNDECHWAFYDRSRNHGGTWCEMSSCGNKLKNRQFRARKRKASER